MTKVEKYVRKDGKVAVLYSPGFGAGWSTWCSDATVKDHLLFDKNIVEIVLQSDHQQLEQNVTQYVNSVWGDYAVYCGGAGDLEIAWMEPETKFIVREYDGNEFLETEKDFLWSVA